jgi:hypothetical protein
MVAVATDIAGGHVTITNAPALTLRQALVRKFAITAATPSRPVTEYPELAADLAAGIAEPFLQRARCEERARCAVLLREWAGELSDLLCAGAVAEAADLLDPPIAAPRR